jgi:adenosylcobinamide-phosphate synthase
MLWPETLPLLAAALAVEAVAGYPNRLYMRIGHPVTWIGRLIAQLDAAFNQEGRSKRWKYGAGITAIGLVMLILLVASGGLAWLLGRWSLAGFVASALVGSTLLAQKSLHDHVRAVSRALREEGLKGGRLAVSQIVGRNPDSLDEAGVCRAAIESLAENFADGVVAPAFWLGVAGLPGGALYKAVNTADSMIGHRTPRHAAFGWASARLDDLLNFPASRLAALLIILAAALHRGASAMRALRAVSRDAPHHRSPNAGWPEAAMAGALGLRLAGPRIYGDTRIEDRWMGVGRSEATPADIERALVLYRTSCALLFASVAGLIGLIFAIPH